MNTLKPPSCALCVQVERERDAIRQREGDLRKALRECIARAGYPDAAEACRLVIARAKVALGYEQSRQEIDQVPKSSIPEAAIGRPPNKPPGDEL